MELQKIIGANIRHYRRAAGWTLEQLSAEVGVSRETIGKIERGSAAPLFETAERIASALGIQALALFTLEPTPAGERGRCLASINSTLSGMNDEQLDRADKMLKAFVGK
jgi:transcriptional regulator with XRE-family HTH domain